jgi:hypothetical protein
MGGGDENETGMLGAFTLGGPAEQLQKAFGQPFLKA